MSDLGFHEWRPHPWHGLPVGREPPLAVNAYIEITPFDLIKYEVDKESGYLRVDRPQRGSNQAPALYGFIPRTFCGERVSALAPAAVGFRIYFGEHGLAVFQQPGRLAGRPFGPIGADMMKTLRPITDQDIDKVAVGNTLNDEVIAAIADRAFQQCHPLENIIVDPEWRRAMIPLHARRLLSSLAS